MKLILKKAWGHRFISLGPFSVTLVKKGIIYYYLFIYGACVDNFSVLFSYTALLYIARYSVRPEKTHHLCLPGLQLKQGSTF